MIRVAFKDGVLKLNTAIGDGHETAVFLAFNKANADHKQYEVIRDALPRIKGLKRKSNRSKFAFEIVEQVIKQGYEIIKK